MSLKSEEIVFNNIVNRLVSGELQPGFRFYEPELVADTGLSRTPVRQALARLMTLGILERVPQQKGYIIPKLTRQGFEDVFLARCAIEGMAAYQAATRRSEEHLVRLRSWQEEHLQLMGLSDRHSRSRIASLNELIHREILYASGNQYLLRIFEPIYWRSSLYTFHFSPYYVAHDVSKLAHGASYREHQELIETISQKKPEEARRVAEEHITRTRTERINRGDLSTLED